MIYFFHKSAGVCGKLSENSLCKKCEILLNKQEKFIIHENEEIQNYYDKHISFFKYEGLIRSLILEYKFRDNSYLYKTFTNFILKNKNFCRLSKSYDIIIPVPISKKRNKERGYNQSLLIARELSKQLNIKLINNCLYKTQNIIEQSKLNKEERKVNIHGVYSLVHPEKLINKKILLIDDIFTTGSTANECCKTIKNNANPEEICILTIAKD